MKSQTVGCIQDRYGYHDHDSKQWAYLKYRNNRYMQHLTDSELSDKLDDCGNIGVGLKDGKVAISNPIEGRPDDYPGFGFVWQKLADIF